MSTPIPATYSDIGKSASDLFGKDFPVGAFKLEAKNTAPNGVSFTLTGQKDTKNGAINGELKSKYYYPKRGGTFTGSWTTGNQLNGQVELENSLAKGLKLDLLTSIQPATGNRNVRGGFTFKQPGLHTKLYVDALKGPIFQGDIVVGHEGFLVGAEGFYDVLDGKLTRYGVAAGYTHPEYNVALRVTNSMSAYTLLYYHRVSSEIEAGAKAHWDSHSNNAQVNLEFGAKYFLDRDAFVKGKVDNNGRVGIGYTQALRPGVKISFGGSIDTSRLNENAHRFGISINLES
ncbi:8734_t:CDS:2 [Funneliformis geosporum]|uniref:4634_t:CDS:1 n=1 Tax=Funneliformis geosporum TaxID=1117311 RepID=A0A9W4SQW9_9GLOM|nr:8734_t:CDS:2 [Funneliformis geosporum]CAI2177641.1 4634_t:CDS:2 [Funneliformis geosporum]